MYPFVQTADALCINHYVLRECAIGHTYLNCPLVRNENVCDAVIPWGDRCESFWTVAFIRPPLSH
ncbi:hypothetical protein AURDEDRAFT_177992 [Auricularia subglabra TFB-10046 SS5]|uniref:Uncharacterized protein n=1 Tax=Auricularia subglabra (strain TFB-10046 / SS5) TaxID=717982 RepID=J0WM86_AURST|nr:hypothetical protein AURDEDRAFT_177992 [Auricularia subglabra TFB-10046 SS5]